MSSNTIPVPEGLKRIEIRRPQYPWILEWIDREFHVRWVNVCAAPGANISWLLEDDDYEEEEEGGMECLQPGLQNC